MELSLKQCQRREEGFNITVEDIKNWQKDNVTIALIASINQFIYDKDEAVHRCLLDSKIDEAKEANNSMDAARFILELPEDFIEEAKTAEEKERQDAATRKK